MRDEIPSVALPVLSYGNKLKVLPVRGLVIRKRSLIDIDFLRPKLLYVC